MTDRSKSQRKRRIQLNAEEFAPPPDLYESSAEPRLDETWVQYYGGEKHGGLKRLLTVEEEGGPGQPDDALASSGSPAAHQRELDEAAPTDPSQTSEIQATESVDTTQLDRPPRPVVSSLEDFRKHEPAKVAAVHAPPTPDKPPVKETPAKGLITAEAESSDDISPGPPSPSPGAESDAPSFEEWSDRWSPWLKRGGSIKVCAAFYELTHAQGSAECFTSNSAIMEITKLSRSQCIRNIHYLIEMGFLEELHEVNSREGKGTYYRFNVVPKSIASV